MSWERLKVLQPGFVARVLVLRTALLVSCIYAVDTFQTAVAAGISEKGGAWGWAGRVNLAGLQLPLLLNLWGLLWPLCYTSSFEKHHTTWHRGLVWVVVASKVLEQLSGWVGGSSCAQAFLMHGILFVVHQDPDFIRSGLAPMAAAYSLTDAWCSYGNCSTMASSLPAEQLSPVDQLLQGMTNTQFFLHSIITILLVHQIVNRIAGPPKQARPVATTATGLRGLAAPSNPLSMRSSSATRMTSCSSARSSSTDSTLCRVSSASGQLARLPPLYVTKLAMVSLCDAMFSGLLAWQLLGSDSQHNAANALGSSSSSSGSNNIWSQQTIWKACSMLTPGHTLVWHAAAQGLHAVLCIWQPAWLWRHIDTVNRASFCSAAGARAGLLLAVVAGNDHETAPGLVLVSKAWPQVVFHSFLVLVPAVVVHETHWLEIGAKLLPCAALFRWLHLRLLALSGAAAGANWNCLCVPEYAVVVVMVLACYPMLNWERDRQETARDLFQGRLRRSGSISNHRASVADSVGPAEGVAPVMACLAVPGRASVDTSGHHSSKPKMQLSVTVPTSRPGLNYTWEVPEDSAQPKGMPPVSPSRLRQQSQAGRSNLSRMSLGGAEPPQGPHKELVQAPAAASAAAPSGYAGLLTAVRAEWSKARERTKAAAVEWFSWCSVSLHRRAARVDDPAATSRASPAAAEGGWQSWLGQLKPGGSRGLRYSFSWARAASPKDSMGGSAASPSAAGSPRHEPMSAECRTGLIPDAAQVAFMQRIVIDLFASTSCGLHGLTQAPMFMREVFQPQKPVDMLARALALLGIIFYLGSNMVHAAVRCWQPKKTASARDSWWVAALLWSQAVMQVAVYLLRLEPLRDPLLHLNILAVGAAILLLPPRLMGKWLPLLCTTFYGLQAIEKWSTVAVSKLLVEGLEYVVLPSAIYGAMWVLYKPLYNLSWQRVYVGMAKAGGDRVTNRPLPWMMAAGFIGHQMVATLPMWAPLLLPSLPDAWNPVLLQETAKATLAAMLDRMDVKTGSNMDTIQTLAAVLAVGLCFLVVSSLQAFILSSRAFINPRQAWYEEAKGKVTRLGEATMSALQGLEENAGPAVLQQALLDTLRGLVQDCFAGSTLLLVVPEQEHDLDGPAVQRHVLLPGPDAGLDVPEQETVLLEELPSVVAACEQGCALWKTGVQPLDAEYADWADLAAAYGVDSIMVLPLTCVGENLGALLLAARLPVTLDAHSRNLATDLSHALSQTLYTLTCIRQMRAGEQIIQDIMPQKVAEQLRKRLVTHGSSSSQEQGSPPRGPSPCGFGSRFEQLHDSHHSPLPSRFGSPAPDTFRQHQQQQQASGQDSEQDETLPSGLRRGGSGSALNRGSLPGHDYDAPVVYKQWHSAVTVLFADISSYTAMSTQVEPEEVMLLLHELFSKYDHLCKRFGIYKVETIGDCYMACSGLLVDNPDHALHMVQFAKAMLGAAASVRNPLGGSVHIRVGVHSGRVMSGIVGSIRARYCLFGDTVNTASRMESTGVVDHIQVSEDTYCLLGDLQQDFELRQAVSVKGKGVMQTYLLREEAAADCMAGFEGRDTLPGHATPGAQI